jgi:hypothetical protein
MFTATNGQFPHSFSIAHCFHSVYQQVHNDLLVLDAIGVKSLAGSED